MPLNQNGQSKSIPDLNLGMWKDKEENISSWNRWGNRLTQLSRYLEERYGLIISDAEPGPIFGKYLGHAR